MEASFREDFAARFSETWRTGHCSCLLRPSTLAARRCCAARRLLDWGIELASILQAGLAEKVLTAP